MTQLPFRSHKSDLLDSELVLLDVLFNGDCQFRLLRNEVFRAQWSFPFSHGLDDDALRATLRSMCERGLLGVHRETGPVRFHMTRLGFDAWSDERCPIWERFCTWHTRDRSNGRTRITVVAVSPEVRNDFIRYWPPYPARRRIKAIADYGLVAFRVFDTLHVGFAWFIEPQPSTCNDLDAFTQNYKRNLSRIREHRSWWGTVPQLQRFHSNAA